jgi:hypothetical protein
MRGIKVIGDWSVTKQRSYHGPITNHFAFCIFLP